MCKEWQILTRTYRPIVQRNAGIDNADLLFRLAGSENDIARFFTLVPDTVVCSTTVSGSQLIAVRSFRVQTQPAENWIPCRTRGQMTDSELDVEFLMWDLQRRLQTDQLPGGETVLCFVFDEQERFKTWWLLACQDGVDLCSENQGKEVDLYINTTVRDLAGIWRGDVPLATALRQKIIRTHGNVGLARSIQNWLGICLYADIEPASPQ